MFKRLFKRPHTLARHCNGPLAESRERYLSQWAEQGMSSVTLRIMADYLLTVVQYLRLNERNGKSITLAEIEAAARAWANRVPNRPGW
jgi:hypothetical protein